MQPRHPVLRVPEAIGTARAARPRSVAAAFGLVLALASPVVGAPPQQAAPGAPTTTTTTGPPIDIPARPPGQEAPTPLAVPPGSTTLISIDRAGGVANGASAGRPDGPVASWAGGPSISSNGRYVAFPSLASDLVAGDNNRAMDIFVRDRRAGGSTIRLPVPGGPPPALGRAFHPSMSADGSAVAFAYVAPQTATTFVPPCSGRPLIVLWRRATNTTSVVSLFPNGSLACTATEPSVSGDGRFVAFTWTGSGATAVTSRDVYVRDTTNGTTVRASSSVAGLTADGDSYDPAISRDGRIVAFASAADDLVAGDANKQRDVFTFDRISGTTELVSIGDGGQANGLSDAPAISADGSRIAFDSRATNLVAGLSPTAQNVYVRDRAAGRTLVASMTSGGAAATAESGQASISLDGQVVAFASAAPNLVTSGDNAVLAALNEGRGGGYEVFAHDMITGQTIRISDRPNGAAAGSQNLRPAIGGNGRFVAFESTSALLVAGDTNKLRDVFLRDLPPAAAVGPAALDFGTRAIGVPGPPLAAILTNTGWGVLTVADATETGAAAADYEVALNSCQGRTLRWLESCPVTVVFTPTARGSRIAALAVAHDAPGSPATVGLRGGGSQAELKLDPPIGQPGIVIIARGSGFPGNTQVALTWSRGVTGTMPTITTDSTGAFRVQVLVFHNDIVGARDLVASPVASAAFPAFGAAFLVAEASSQPPRFIVQSPYDDRPATLVMRR